MMRKTLLLGSFSLFISTTFILQNACPSLALAQTVPSLPGALIQSNVDPINRQPESVQTVPGSAGPQDNRTTPIITDQTKKPVLDQTLTRKIFIKKIEVTGAKHLDPKAIQAIIAPYEGHEISLPELQENVSDKLTRLYEAKGYVTTLVFIPPQTIADGILKITADEGIVSKVTYQERRWFKRPAVLPRIDVATGQIFDLNDLQRSLRRINENPDLNVQATLRPGDNPGETTVLLQPNRENFPLHVTPFLDNLGRTIIGNQRYGVTVNDNNVFGLGDTAYSSISFTDKSFGILNGYEVPVGKHGTKIGFNQARSNFSLHSNGFKLEGTSNLYNLYVSQEFHRTEHSILGGELGFALKNSEFDIASNRINEDRLFVATPAVNYREFDRKGQLLIRQELGLGLDALGAKGDGNPSASRPGAGSQFARLTGSIVRNQILPWSTYGIFRAQYQYTPDDLVSLEQFQLGGAATVRGYQEGRLIADSGIVLSAEWRLPAIIFPKTLTFYHTNYNLRQNIQFVTFADGGAVYDNDAARGNGVNPRGRIGTANDYLASVGVGLRIRLTHYLNGRLDLGFPLTHPKPDSQVARLHFGIESALF